MGRFRTLNVPIELALAVVEALNDRLDDLEELIEADGMGLAETELRAERRGLEQILEQLEE